MIFYRSTFAIKKIPDVVTAVTTGLSIQVANASHKVYQWSLE